jgi:enoyl-CoA hydratase/carnithine racemase
MTATDFVVVTHSEGLVTIGLNRPDKRNALSLALVSQLRAVIEEHRHEPAVMIITSANPNMFIAGADIAELDARGEEEAFRAINVELFDAIASWRWPTIAAIDGPAFGGGLECALACDLRIASPRARFAQPELGLGILAGAGGNWRLPELVGLGLARRMLYLGEVVDADRALAMGLVDELVEEPVLRAQHWAQQIGTKPWRALEITKLALGSGVRPSSQLIDILGQAILFESDAKRERMRSFLDRRSS